MAGSDCLFQATMSSFNSSRHNPYMDIWVFCVFKHSTHLDHFNLDVFELWLFLLTCISTSNIVGSSSNCFHANDSKDWTGVFVVPYKEIHLVQVSYTAAVMNINISSSSKIVDVQNKFFIRRIMAQTKTPSLIY